MSTEPADRLLLEQSVERLFVERCGPQVVAAAEGGYDPDLWSLVEQAGFTLAGLPESAGGEGDDLHSAAAVVRIAARHAAPLPLAETALLAGWALASAGLPVPAGPLAAAWSTADAPLELRREGNEWHLSGEATDVAFARAARAIVIVAYSRQQAMVATVDPSSATLTEHQNLAAEPRDTLRFENVALPATAVAEAGAGADPPAIALRCALVRSIQLAGALETVLRLTAIHATEREQFGRPIGRFQAVQQQLAELAAETAAAVAAVEQAVDAVAHAGEHAAAEQVAIAKLRTSESAGAVAAIAHQIHGAIGVTREHQLQHFTRRLWSWRDEDGNEGVWARWLGHRVLARGADALWPSMINHH